MAKKPNEPQTSNDTIMFNTLCPTLVTGWELVQPGNLVRFDFYDAALHRITRTLVGSVSDVCELDEIYEVHLSHCLDTDFKVTSNEKHLTLRFPKGLYVFGDTDKVPFPRGKVAIKYGTYKAVARKLVRWHTDRIKDYDRRVARLQAELKDCLRCRNVHCKSVRSIQKQYGV